MNDAEEFSHALSIAENLLLKRRLEAESQLEKDCCAALDESLARIARATVCVVSFSERGNLLSQWRAYCLDGGFSLGFSADYLRAIGRRDGFSLEQCLYTRREKERLLAPILDEAVQQFDKRVRDGDDFETTRENVLRIAFNRFYRIAPRAKHAAFSEEKEWRLISNPIRTERLHFRTDSGLLVPYFRLPLEPDDISFRDPRLFVGPSRHQRLTRDAACKLLNSEGVEGWRVTPSRIPYRNLR